MLRLSLSAAERWHSDLWAAIVRIEPMRTLMKWPEDEDLRPRPGAVVATSFNHIRLVIGAEH